MTEETARARRDRLMAETGLSIHQVSKRIQRGESDDSIREWGVSFFQIEAESRARLHDNMRAYFRAHRADVLAWLDGDDDD